MSIQRRNTKRRGTVYDVRLRDPSGGTYNRTFRTKREAETFEVRELADRSRGAWVDPRRQARTFGDVAAEWLASNPAKRPSSLAQDDLIVRRHLLPRFGADPVASVSKPAVQALVVVWSHRRAPRTTARRYGVLRAILNYAVDCDYVVRTPCRGAKLPMVEPVARPLAAELGPDDLSRLADAIGAHLAPMVYLGAVLGLRWGECVAVRVGRINFLRSTLSVAAQMTRGANGVIVEGPPKSNMGRRTMTAPAPLMMMLSDHLAREGLTGQDADALVFTAPSGGPVVYGNWRSRVWLPATRQAGLPGLTFHDLRVRHEAPCIRAG